MARQGDTQKSFYLRDALAARFDRVIASRRKSGQKISERRAFELAIRAFVETEERLLALGPQSSTLDLVDKASVLLSEAIVRLGGRSA